MTTDREGVVRVLSNVCRHRGTVLVEGRGNAKALRCPHHHWTFAMNGELRGTPQMDRVEFDKSAHCLPEYRRELWNGFLFMTFDSDIAPLSPTTRVDSIEIEAHMLVDYERAAAADLEKMQQAQQDLVQTVFDEDGEMNRRTFLGLQSSAAAGGRMSHQELNIWQLQNWLLDLLDLEAV